MSETGAVILVVEGPSAAGKSTWLARWEPKLVVAEHGRIEPQPQSATDEAQFWADLNASRWNRALTVEERHGRALCDTDPLKLHYDYCRARAGVVAWSLFESGVKACTVAVLQRRLGIADLTLCAIPDAETLNARKRDDASRTRRNFDLHRHFGPALRDWYRTLEALDPGRVRWSFPDTVPSADARDRYDIELFKTWMSALPGRPNPGR